MVKPSDFFVDIVDFFAILLPGAILTALLLPVIDMALLERLFPLLEKPTTGWAAFLVAAYILGHVSSTLGGPLDPLADRISDRVELTQSADLRVYARNAIQKFVGGQSFAPTSGFIAAYVRQRSAIAATELDRLQSISRFFRNLIVVLLTGILMFLTWRRNLDGVGSAISASVVLLLFSSWLYGYQRWKRKQAIYRHFVAMACCEQSSESPREAA
jgi:hypothetical protein